MKHKKQCLAHTRTTGMPCKAQALTNGRCKLHGGMSTGPRTEAGKKAISNATLKRLYDPFNSQLQAMKSGYRVWLETGGREYLSKLKMGDRKPR